MTTRRKFGMGIAAMLAAQRAPAALIRSLVAGRHISATGTRLPYDAEVAYLESTGTQWIDTGYHVIAGLGCEISGAVPSGHGTWRYYPFLGWTNDYQGGGQYTRTFRVGMYVNSAPTTAQFAVGDGRVAMSDIAYSSGFGTVFTLEYNSQDNTFDLDGTTINNPNTLTYETETRNVKTMPLFGERNNNNFSGGSVRIREAKFFYNGMLAKDLIAVRFTNELGQTEGAMYDRVSGQLFRNQGTGAFLWAEKQ